MHAMIWFDLDNSPHVPLFRPILRELEQRSEPFFVTSRAHAQTEDLLRLWKMPFVSVGVHGGRSTARKILNLISRSTSLIKAARGKGVTLAMSHGSRTHLVAAKRMKIPYIWMQDYEYQEKALANFLADHILLPACIPDQRVADSGYTLRKVIRYDGLKEEIYLRDFVPQAGFRKSIGVSESAILVTMRPPSVTANYHDEKSERLFRRCLEYLSSFPRVHCLIANRTTAERDLVLSGKSAGGKVDVLRNAVDGLQLLWHSDLVIGGGGTMNREAAALGVPVYSIFRGKIGAVDRYLVKSGRLTLLESVGDVQTKLVVAKRSHSSGIQNINGKALNSIVEGIIKALKVHQQNERR